MKKFLDKNKYIITTFLSGILVISLIFIIQKTLPFGKNSLLAVDFYHQYGPMLGELYDKVMHGGNLIYSFNVGLGIPYYRNFLNYLSSPFNIILFLFKREHILTAFSFIIGLKAIAASTTMAYYLQKKFKKESILIIVFGLAYGFSNYFTAYYWNLMWLDGMVFLPLIILGIENIINKGKIKLYLLSLATMLFANYFIGYMICIFSVIYFFAYYFIKNKFRFYSFYKACLRFFIGSILAFGIVAVFLIPMYYALKSISATHDLFPQILEYNFNLLNFFANHYAGVVPTVFASDKLPLPNVSSSIIVILSVLLFFVNKNISIKKKLIYLLLIILFVSSFEIKTFDFIWHAFHVPNDLPYRYSFIYIFLLCLIGYESAINIRKLKYIYSFILYVFILGMLLLLKTRYFVNIDSYIFITNALFISLYLIVYTLYKYNIFNKKYIEVSLIVFILSEMVLVNNHNLNIDQNSVDYINKYTINNFALKELKEKDKGLYRIEEKDYMTYNDGAFVGYNGISTFSSMAYERVSKLQRKLGMGSNDINSYYYNMQTPVYNSMFGIKYIIGDLENNSYYDLFIDEGDKIYKYNYNLPILFPVNKGIKDWTNYSQDPFENQSNFILQATGVSGIFDKVYVDKISGCEVNSFNGDYLDFKLHKNINDLIITYKNNNYKNLYGYFYNANINSVSTLENYKYFSPNEPYIIEIPKIEEQKIDVTINFKSNEESYLYAYMYNINSDNFIKAYSILNKNNVKITNYKSNRIESSVKVDYSMTMYSSIPYDNGWKVYINNKQVKTFKLAESLLGFDIPKGENNIKLIYIPEKFYLGISISLISLCIIMVYELNTIKRKK